jgi:hypothetical protein
MVMIVIVFGLGLLTGICVTCVAARWTLQRDGRYRRDEWNHHGVPWPTTIDGDRLFLGAGVPSGSWREDHGCNLRAFKDRHAKENGAPREASPDADRLSLFRVNP